MRSIGIIDIKLQQGAKWCPLSNKERNGNSEGNNKPPVDTTDNGGETPTDTLCNLVICTQDSREVYLEVLDANGNPIILDNYPHWSKHLL